MKIKRIKKLRIGPYLFDVKWNKNYKGGRFDYSEKVIEIDASADEEKLYHIVSHEMWEMASIEMNVRLHKPGTQDDYIFLFDHGQYDSLMYLYSGLMLQFLE